jgi:flagellar biosynthetic protein FliP
MIYKRGTILLLMLFVLNRVNVSFGRPGEPFGQIGSTPATIANGVPIGNTTLPTLPALTVTEGTGLDDTTTKGIPSMQDLMTLVDKATTTEAEAKDWSTPVKLVIIFTCLAILPSLMVMMTSFTRIVIVLAFIRRALSTQSIPPTVAVIGLALFLTLYTMSPTFSKINEVGIQPYLSDTIDFPTCVGKTTDCLKEFMLRQSREPDLTLFLKMAKVPPPTSPMEIGLHVVVPAFIISEFRTAFEIGCLLFIPFLVVDIVIASVLLSAGMMMLPPMMISLPFKLMLFILVDGWGLLARSLTLSFS